MDVIDIYHSALGLSQGSGQAYKRTNPNKGKGKTKHEEAKAQRSNPQHSNQAMCNTKHAAQTSPTRNKQYECNYQSQKTVQRVEPG